MGRKLLVALLSTAGLAAIAAAQPANPDSNGPVFMNLGLGLASSRYNPVVVLKNERVRQELKLTDAQKKRLQTIETERGQVRVRMFEALQQKEKELGEPPDPQARALVRQAYRDWRTQDNKEATTAHLKVLDRDQLKRLDQIRIQAEGTKAFLRPEVQERLNLSPDQVAQINEIIVEGDRAIARVRMLPQSITPPKTDTIAERKAASIAEQKAASIAARKAFLSSKSYQDAVKAGRTRAVELRTATMRQIARVLTKRQRTAYQAMLGEPFDFTGAWEPPPAAADPARAKSPP